MTSQEIVEGLRKTGMDRSLAYKVKNHKMEDTACFRWIGGKWVNTLAPERDYGPELEIILQLCLAAIVGNHVVIFDCCCEECYTPARVAWTEAFRARTGLGISHGYWEPCFVKLMEAHGAPVA